MEITELIKRNLISCVLIIMINGFLILVISIYPRMINMDIFTNTRQLIISKEKKYCTCFLCTSFKIMSIGINISISISINLLLNSTLRALPGNSSLQVFHVSSCHVKRWILQQCDICHIWKRKLEKDELSFDWATLIQNRREEHVFQEDNLEREQDEK